MLPLVVYHRQRNCIVISHPPTTLCSNRVVSKVAHLFVLSNSTFPSKSVGFIQLVDPLRDLLKQRMPACIHQCQHPCGIANPRPRTCPRTHYAQIFCVVRTFFKRVIECVHGAGCFVHVRFNASPGQVWVYLHQQQGVQSWGGPSTISWRSRRPTSYTHLDELLCTVQLQQLHFHSRVDQSLSHGNSVDIQPRCPHR